MKLAHDVENTLEFKKSRFITLLHAVQSEEEAREFIKSVKKEYPDATHHCTAIKIGNVCRSSDDGEPSGTAGRPMLDVLMGSEVDGIVAVVVRYFGGTLLGKGGLVKAYSSSVSEAMKLAEFLEVQQLKFYQAVFDYDLIGKVDGWLRSRNITPVSSDYTSQVIYYIASNEDILAGLAATTGGKANVTYLKDIFTEQIHTSHI